MRPCVPVKILRAISTVSLITALAVGGKLFLEGLGLGTQNISGFFKDVAEFLSELVFDREVLVFQINERDIHGDSFWDYCFTFSTNA